MVKGVEHISTIVLIHLSGAGSSPAGSVGRDLNLQKLNLTTSVAVILSSPRSRSELIDSVWGYRPWIKMHKK